MSQETITWLNNYTLIGHTDQRGHAWHYRRSDQGAEPNHYEGAVPVEDIRRRLFGWKVAEGDVTSTATILSADGVESVSITDPNRKTMLRPPGALGPGDEGAILGVFSKSYSGHDYEEWLLDKVSHLLDDSLSIGSAGLLRGGAQAWLSVDVPESITTPEGVAFRPHLLATTSFDGSLATDYRRVVTNVVCDNTMAAGLREGGQSFKVKHSKNSRLRLLAARDALQLIHQVAEDFEAQVAELSATRVSDHDWDRFLAQLAPTEQDGEPLTGRKLTMATNKREQLSQLWTTDQRVAPWKNTAWGVVQAVNTHTHHVKAVRGTERAARNMALAVTGSFDKLDAETLNTLRAVLV